jgi:hypothetical protein
MSGKSQRLKAGRFELGPRGKSPAFEKPPLIFRIASGSGPVFAI